MSYFGSYVGMAFGQWFGDLVQQIEHLLLGDQLFVTTLRQEIYANPDVPRADVLLRTYYEYTSSDVPSTVVGKPPKQAALKAREYLAKAVALPVSQNLLFQEDDIAVLEDLVVRYVTDSTNSKHVSAEPTTFFINV